MPVRPTPLRIGATRAEKIAALPAFPKSASAVALEARLDRMSETALSTLSDLDSALTDLADEFAIRFAQDDERAASRDRIANTAQAHRDAKRRG